MSRDGRAELEAKAPLSGEQGRNRQSSPESSCLTVSKSVSSLRLSGLGTRWLHQTLILDTVAFPQPRGFKPGNPHKEMTSTMVVFTVQAQRNSHVLVVQPTTRNYSNSHKRKRSSRERRCDRLTEEDSAKERMESGTRCSVVET